MSISPDGDGTKVERTGRITTIPWYMAPMKLLYSMAAPMDDKKLTQKMKADLEGQIASDRVFYCQFLDLGRLFMAGMGSTCLATIFMVPPRRETSPRMINIGSLMS